MADKTNIEWTDATWNVVNGCTVHSPGCTNCYAMKQAHRFPPRQGLTVKTNGGMVWTGEVRFNEAVLTQPLRWKRPRRIFVCAHGDLFHEKVPDEWIDRVFAVMALCPQHQFQVLTKRSARMREYLTSEWFGFRVRNAMQAIKPQPIIEMFLPLPNVWLGVSVEDQQRAYERVPDLLATPAAVRWLSCEPLLGPVDLREVCGGWYFQNALTGQRWHDAPDGIPSAVEMAAPRIDWIVVGGESGPKARPMHPDWARSLRDQCHAAGVPFLFKQWGEWALQDQLPPIDPTDWNVRDWEKVFLDEGACGPLYRVGKKRAGRLLDCVEHNGFPQQQEQAA